MKRSFCDRNIANFKQCILHEPWDFVHESIALRNSVTSYFGDQLEINKDDISKT